MNMFAEALFGEQGSRFEKPQGVPLYGFMEPG